MALIEAERKTARAAAVREAEAAVTAAMAEERAKHGGQTKAAVNAAVAAARLDERRAQQVSRDGLG